MNPIRFSKLVSQMKTEKEEQIRTCNTWKKEVLIEFCKSHGFSHEGDSRELIARTRVILERQLSLIAFGELSNFGRSLITRIFDKFKKSNIGGLSLWELNSMLSAIDSQTIFDIVEFKDIVKSEEYLLDEEGNLSRKALDAYFEKYFF